MLPLRLVYDYLNDFKHINHTKCRCLHSCRPKLGKIQFFYLVVSHFFPQKLWLRIWNMPVLKIKLESLLTRSYWGSMRTNNGMLQRCRPVPLCCTFQTFSYITTSHTHSAHTPHHTTLAIKNVLLYKCLGQCFGSRCIM